MAEEDWNWTPEGPVGEVWSNVSGRFSAMFAHVDHKVKLQVLGLHQVGSIN